MKNEPHKRGAFIHWLQGVLTPLNFQVCTCTRMAEQVPTDVPQVVAETSSHRKQRVCSCIAEKLLFGYNCTQPAARATVEAESIG